MAKLSKKQLKHQAAEQAAKEAAAPKQRLLMLAVAALTIVVVALAATLWANHVPSNAAAKVDNTYITESEVEEWISQYRAQYSLEDDADFADALLDGGYNVETFRTNAINQLALNYAIKKRAKELGYTITDADAQAELDATREAYVFNDDETWESTLEGLSLTEESLKAQYKVNLAKAAICQDEVAEVEATEEDVAAYINSYLANTTQMHAYRIVFSEDSVDAATECYDALCEVAEEGTLTLDTFIEYALAYSEEEDVAETEGRYSWSGSGMTSEIKEIMAYLAEGEISELESLTDGSFVILFVDDTYAFESIADDEALPTDIPDELYEELFDACADELWSTACDNYLAELLKEVQITYYPMPASAPYDVTALMTTTTDTEGATETEDTEDEDTNEV